MIIYNKYLFFSLKFLQNYTFVYFKFTNGTYNLTEKWNFTPIFSLLINIIAFRGVEQCLR